jgi:hypothetical protein
MERQHGPDGGEQDLLRVVAHSEHIGIDAA